MNIGKISDRRRAEATARASMVMYGWIRRTLSRLFESMLYPLVNIVGRQPGDPEEEPRSILVVQYWHLGDTVMMTPFLKQLRHHYPRARITLLANPKVIPLLEGRKWVDEVVAVHVPWTQHDSRWKKYISPHWIDFFRCLAGLRAKTFDWGFSARADVRDNFILWAAGVKRRVGYGFGGGASLLTDVVAPDTSRPHYTDRWLRLLEYLGKPTQDRQPELNLTAEERYAAQRYLSALGVRDTEIVIGVHAGARNPIRQWGEQNFFEVAKRLASRFPVKVIWFREPDGAGIGSGTEPWMVPVTLPLRQLLAVLAKCRLLLCNDTGPMHFATAVGVPVVAVFGATMPAWWGPRLDGSQVVAHEGVWCRPCNDRCHFDEPYCLRAVSVERVLNAAESSLAKVILINSPEVGTQVIFNQVVEGKY